MVTKFVWGTGYILVDPGLCMPEHGLSPHNPDAQVRCLCYLIPKIYELNLAPQEARFKVIVAEYIGGPYPCIGMYTDVFVDTNENLTRLSFAIEDGLATFVSKIGTHQLLQLSSAETLRWQDVMEEREV